MVQWMTFKQKNCEQKEIIAIGQIVHVHQNFNCYIVQWYYIAQKSLSEFVTCIALFLQKSLWSTKYSIFLLNTEQLIVKKSHFFYFLFFKSLSFIWGGGDKCKLPGLSTTWKSWYQEPHVLGTRSTCLSILLQKCWERRKQDNCRAITTWRKVHFTELKSRNSTAINFKEVLW